eukprot:15485285-Alexandrium_andersonii.AAC.1
MASSTDARILHRALCAQGRVAWGGCAEPREHSTPASLARSRVAGPSRRGGRASHPAAEHGQRRSRSTRA